MDCVVADTKILAAGCKDVSCVASAFVVKEE